MLSQDRAYIFSHAPPAAHMSCLTSSAHTVCIRSGLPADRGSLIHCPSARQPSTPKRSRSFEAPFNRRALSCCCCQSSTIPIHASREAAKAHQHAHTAPSCAREAFISAHRAERSSFTRLSCRCSKNRRWFCADVKVGLQQRDNRSLLTRLKATLLALNRDGRIEMP